MRHCAESPNLLNLEPMGHLERPATETSATLSVRIFPQYFNDSGLAMDGDFRSADRAHPDAVALA
mgnify:CR=1 FL=1